MFKHLTIMTRFAILIATIAITSSFLFAIVEYTLKSAIRDIDYVFYIGVDNLKDLVNLRVFSQNILNTASQVWDGTFSSAQALNNISEARMKIEDSWLDYLKDIKLYSQITITNQSMIDRLESQVKELMVAAEKFENALKQNDKEAITRLITQDLSFIISSFLKESHRLILLHVEETEHAYQGAIADMSALKQNFLFVLLCMLLFVITIAIWIALSVTRPLKKAVDMIHKLTLGDLSYHIENTSKNEIGQLFESMNSLSNSSKQFSDALKEVSNGNLNISVQPRSDKDAVSLSLMNMIKKLKNMSDAFMAISKGDLTIKVHAQSEKDTLGLALVNMVKNLKHIIGELQKEIANLTTSSQTIVNSISQVATTSAETAAAITEITTSMEELKQTAHVTDEKAKDVLQTSEKTLQVVSSSENLLQATMDDMRQINEKMHTISEGIIKLSEHSQTIGKIIDTVNDLAEQSNLLAVNAAIEAAKAGEHGKGFVVVAQEIRTLAEQSKSATIQVRSILHEIQNSTTAAVLATEQGTKAVEKGVKQSEQTNDSMITLSTSVTNVTQAANQIAISSQQQFVGIDQVSSAMNNIKEAATQLVDHMKQMEFSIASLNSIGDNLKEMADQYIMAKSDKRSSPKFKQTEMNPSDTYVLSFDGETK